MRRADPQGKKRSRGTWIERSHVVIGGEYEGEQRRTDAG